VTDDGIARRERPAGEPRHTWAVGAEPGHQDGRDRVVFRCVEESCPCGGELLQLPDRFTVHSLIAAIGRHRVQWGR
jgi:hypothetical protein